MDDSHQGMHWITQEVAEYLLFDVDIDPEERHDLSYVHPQLVTSMSNRLAQVSVFLIPLS